MLNWNKFCDLVLENNQRIKQVHFVNNFCVILLTISEVLAEYHS